VFKANRELEGGVVARLPQVQRPNEVDILRAHGPMNLKEGGVGDHSRDAVRMRGRQSERNRPANTQPVGPGGVLVVGLVVGFRVLVEVWGTMMDAIGEKGVSRSNRGGFRF
jgi:hypothetical protein